MKLLSDKQKELHNMQPSYIAIVTMETKSFSLLDRSNNYIAGFLIRAR
jgi:hypothetical protein